jgi:hypothetical protein
VDVYFPAGLFDVDENLAAGAKAPLLEKVFSAGLKPRPFKAKEA